MVALLLVVTLGSASTHRIGDEPRASQLETPRLQLFLPASYLAQAEPSRPDWLPESIEYEQNPFERGPAVILGRVGGFISGAWASALAHEFGHAAVAWGYRRRFVWPTAGGSPDPFLPFWRVEGELSKAERRNIAMGGFLVSFLSTEVMLALPPVPKDNIFIAGFLFYSILNDVFYAGRDMVSFANGGRGVGDIRDMADGGIPREILYTALIAHSAFAVARLVTNRDFLRLFFWVDQSEER